MIISVLSFLAVCLCSTVSFAFRPAASSTNWWGEENRGRHHSNTKTALSDSVREGCDAGGNLLSTRGDFVNGILTSALATSCVAATIGNPSQAAAFCGDPYPSWAYFLDFDEVMIPFNFQGYSGELLVRTVGNKKAAAKAKHNPIVVIPGGPGLPHDYLETLEGASQDDRVVVEFDPIGTGSSSDLPKDPKQDMPNLFSSSCLSAQVDAVLGHLKISSYHLFSHGSACMVALEKARELGCSPPRPPGPEGEVVLSVTLASPLLNGAVIPKDFMQDLRTTYAKGEEKKVPLCLETAFTGSSMQGFTKTVAELHEGQGANRLEPVPCPVLITYGGRDFVGDRVIEDLQQSLSSSS
ncbi:unnamed protein product, partial [Choristocarpus tenellus]